MIFKDVVLISEQSTFVKSTQTISAPGIYTISSETNTPYNDEFLGSYIYLGTRRTQYTRRYKSFQEVAAEVSGVM